MLVNTKPGGGSSQQRSNPSSPSGSAGNAMEIAALHYEALQKYLLAHILKEKHGVSEQRIAAREKLSRLLLNQLQDLSTDVYDELKRRTDGAQVPFLAVRDEFHPKRNQARQKLATLPQNRFKDLASDVYVQLERQFPQLLEMYPLKALEEKEFLSQPPPNAQSQQQERELTTPAVQQSNVVPNVATFTIQDSSNTEEEDSYYRAPGQQQGPPSPSVLEGGLNYSSLDSLMADLSHAVGKDGLESTKGSATNSLSAGNRGSDSKSNQGINDFYRSRGSESNATLNGLGIKSGVHSGDKMQQEYEIRIQALCKRLQHLESEVGDSANRPEGSRLAQVERQLAKQTELYNEQIVKVTRMQVDYNKVLNDYHAQIETVDMVNQEVKALVMDSNDLRQRHLDVEEELQLAYNKIKQLEDENNDLKADLEEALHNQKKTMQEEPSSRVVVKESVANAPVPISPTSVNIINDQMNTHGDDLHSNRESENNMKKDLDWNHDRQQARMSVLVNPGSVIHKGSLDTFRHAIDDLLQAGRSDSSSSVLLSMKSVVIACKAVTEDLEDYEHEMVDDDSFAELKQELSSGLTQLMSAAKVHSNAFNEDEEEFERTLLELENAAEAIVMDVVNIPKRSGGNNNNVKNSGHGGLENSSHTMDRDHDDETLIYLEKETAVIVSTIQTLLTSLRSSSDTQGISDASDNITKVVDQVIRQTRMTLATPEAIDVPQADELRSQGEMVLEDLENSLDLLIEVREQLEAEPELVQSSSAEAKAVKQKMASASFDIAKYAKELVTLIED
ncbi:component of the polarisome [Modicella reniformis]|uniref:Component of the polarisome n=1 Tax=Modicella reniformis TaxID=1440133 RepID=A0A9P6LU24_9FUNG|nr:component of the polarisome [Modicella reniformis]